jgi:hypothetical protein
LFLVPRHQQKQQLQNDLQQAFKELTDIQKQLLDDYLVRLQQQGQEIDDNTLMLVIKQVIS